jgi:uncharacterized protein YdeI (YjbR/CyaY-like superfamily)
MKAAGKAAWDARTQGVAGYSYESKDAAALTSREERLIQADAKAWNFWQARPPGYRKTVAHWIASAKKPETRARRLEILIRSCQAEEPIPMMRVRKRP